MRGRHLVSRLCLTINTTALTQLLPCPCGVRLVISGLHFSRFDIAQQTLPVLIGTQYALMWLRLQVSVKGRKKQLCPWG